MLSNLFYPNLSLLAVNLSNLILDYDIRRISGHLSSKLQYIINFSLGSFDDFLKRTFLYTCKAPFTHSRIRCRKTPDAKFSSSGMIRRL
jgi:hypothetical protein